MPSVACSLMCKPSQLQSLNVMEEAHFLLFPASIHGRKHDFKMNFGKAIIQAYTTEGFWQVMRPEQTLRLKLRFPSDHSQPQTALYWLIRVMTHYICFNEDVCVACYWLPGWASRADSSAFVANDMKDHHISWSVGTAAVGVTLFELLLSFGRVKFRGVVSQRHKSATTKQTLWQAIVTSVTRRKTKEKILF